MQAKYIALPVSLPSGLNKIKIKIKNPAVDGK